LLFQANIWYSFNFDVKIVIKATTTKNERNLNYKLKYATLLLFLSQYDEYFNKYRSKQTPASSRALCVLSYSSAAFITSLKASNKITRKHLNTLDNVQAKCAGT